MSEHFAFDPASLRRGFLVCALLSAVAMAFALRDGVRHAGTVPFMRAGLCAGLALASGAVALQLRRRPGWGVTLDSNGLTMGRLRRRPPLEILWTQVREARVIGAERNQLAVFWGESQRLMVTARLFASQADFQALVRALEKCVPPPARDA